MSMSEQNFTKHLHIVGSEIRRLRSEQKLSQEAFADVCGLDRTYVGGVERGERNVSLVNLIRISIALKIPLSTLFTCLDGELG